MYYLICTLGKSPPVVTETVDYLNRIRKLPDEMHLIISSDPEVIEGKILIEEAIKNRFGRKIKIFPYSMEEKDIEDKKTLVKLMKNLRKLIEKIKQKNPNGEVYAMLSGGRKTEIIGFFSIAQIAGITKIFHVHSYSVSTINEKLERNRALIKELAEVANKTEFYKANKKTFDEICFPDPSTYKIVEIPVIPIGISYTNKLKETLREIRDNSPSWNDMLKIGYSAEILDMLKINNFLDEVKGRLHLKESAKDILEILED
ncbi:MAG: CRISPR-associated ring nuclease [Candidatus Anstonellaceae archaeon]